MVECTAGWFECHPGWASWAQVIGTFVALAIAIAVPAAQHRMDERRRQKEQRDHSRTARQQIVAALTAEIEATDRILEAKVKTIEMVLAAVEKGEGTKDLSKHPSHPLWISDRVVYKAAASNLGLLPADIVASVVRYYAEIGQAEDTAAYTTDLLTMFRAIKPTLPYVRMRGEILRRELEKYGNCDFSDVPDLKLTIDEIKLAARKTGYDLEPYLQEARAGVTEGIFRAFRPVQEQSAKQEENQRHPLPVKPATVHSGKADG